MKDHVQTFHTRADRYNVVVGKQGDAVGTRNEFVNSDPEALAPVISRMGDASSFMDEVHQRLGSIATDLADAWQGPQADDAAQIISLLQVDVDQIKTDTGKVFDALTFLHTNWVRCRNDASTLGDDEDDRAHAIFSDWTDRQNESMHKMPVELISHNPLSGTGSGHGAGGSGSLGQIPGGASYTPPPFHAGGGSGIGGLGGGGSSLAGAGVGGLGDAGLGTSGTGLGATGGGAGLAGAGAGGAGATGAGGSGFLPPMAGGGGGGNDEQDRERTTWLEEDDDIWGGGDAPSNVIT